MLYKITPMGYFGRVHQNSRGPWFREWYAEDDGLEWYYAFHDMAGAKFLLSSNMTHQDRESFTRLWQAQKRTEGMSWFAGYWMSGEAIMRCSYFRNMAIGWRIASFVAVAQVFKYGFNMIAAQNYQPLIGAYLRKYHAHAA